MLHGCSSAYQDDKDADGRHFTGNWLCPSLQVLVKPGRLAVSVLCPSTFISLKNSFFLMSDRQELGVLKNS